MIAGITSTLMVAGGGTPDKIETCLNVGLVSYTQGDKACGLTYLAMGSSYVTNSYTTTGTYSYYLGSGACTQGLVSEGKASQNTYSGFDFTNVWTMGSEYPILK
jgi:hypothetical protein